MRYLNLSNTVLIVLGFAMMGVYMNCSKVNATDSSSGLTVVNSSVQETGNGELDYVANFQIGEKTHSDLDLVWVIDNSGSMGTEIAHVRSNLDHFTASVGNQSNLKMALISKAGSDNLAITLNSTDPTRFMQINQEVSSVNALLLAGSALCSSPTGACSPYKTTALQGKLNSFLRPDSKKIFVIVTDDESSMTPESFTAAFNQAYPGQNFTLFGFVGLGAQSPCQAKTGNRYIQLASQSAGHTYNVCDQDWTATFSTLAESVLEKVAPTLSLPTKPEAMEIFSVTLNGQPLNSSQYRLSDAGILIDVSLLQPNQSYQIKIHYRLK